MLIFDQYFKSKLYSQAIESARLRAHANIHESHSDKVQRLAIALINKTYIPPHKHDLSHQWEFFHVIEGEIKMIIFDATGVVSNVIFLGEKHDSFAIQLPPGTLHTLVTLSPKSFVFEWKEGPFDPLYAKTIPEWSVGEDDSRSNSCVSFLENAAVGDRFFFM